MNKKNSSFNFFHGKITTNCHPKPESSNCSRKDSALTVRKTFEMVDSQDMNHQAYGGGGGDEHHQQQQS
ncbi:hypothetical protein pipiens_013813 [Culex pipiens pipiens]|uniref:Uncharacterized protein n=1 Tax=Culex pipiens pipiens TaxID=38569 RepID=A0ABD1CX90_CULPP